MQDDNKERIMMGYGKNKGMSCDLPEEERKVWQIQLILEPVGNGGPGGGRWSMGKEGGNLFEKSEIKPAAEKSGGRCLRDGGSIASIGGLRKRLGGRVRAGSRLHLFHTLVTIQPNTGRHKDKQRIFGEMKF